MRYIKWIILTVSLDHMNLFTFKFNRLPIILVFLSHLFYYFSLKLTARQIYLMHKYIYIYLNLRG